MLLQNAEYSKHEIKRLMRLGRLTLIRLDICPVSQPHFISHLSQFHHHYLHPLRSCTEISISLRAIESKALVLPAIWRLITAAAASGWTKVKVSILHSVNPVSTANLQAQRGLVIRRLFEASVKLHVAATLHVGD
jgi:hypothetical protein